MRHDKQKVSWNKKSHWRSEQPDADPQPHRGYHGEENLSRGYSKLQKTCQIFVSTFEQSVHRR